MKYTLRKAVAGDVPEIEITEEDYLTYQQVRKVLSNCLAIEEKYEILISNYLEFEKQIVNRIVSNMIRNEHGYSDLFTIRLQLNVCLVNLLTSARLYVDQLQQHVAVCMPDYADAKKTVEALFSKEYDAYLEYRFMEALRNYVQHCGIPVHWVSSGARWTDLGKDGFLEYFMEVASLRSLLQEDKRFKKSVLDEIGDKVDLIASTRCYIECFSNVHEAVRQMIKEPVANARKTLEEAHNQYRKVYDKNLVGLSACIQSEDGIVEYFPLLLDWDDVRIKLQKRNQKMTNLKKRYATGKIKN
ncbi:MAG: hypothetical protein V9G20_26450 [Candidatus Promineifilaceae bacterium]